MKDIKDYFSSTPESTNNSLSQPEEDAKNEKRDEKREAVCLDVVDGQKPIVSKNDNAKMRKDKANRRKNKNNIKTSKLGTLENKCEETDILVRDTEKSKIGERENEPIEINDYSSKGNAETESKIQISSNTPTENRLKINAFQCLMASRYKVIGSNSPGKELSSNEDFSEQIPRSQLSARKKIFQNWSDSIKNKKRKLEDEEIDTSIKIKLRQRKKRFKRLLNVEGEGEISTDSTEIKLLSGSQPAHKCQSPLIKFGIVYNDSDSNEVRLTNKEEKHKLEQSKMKTKKYSKSKIKNPNKKKKITVLSSTDEYEDNIQNSKGPSINKNKRHRHKRELKNHKEADKCSLTPNTKLWKMRIKLTDSEDNTIKYEEKIDKNSENGINQAEEKSSNVDPDEKIKNYIQIDLDSEKEICQDVGNTNDYKKKVFNEDTNIDKENTSQKHLKNSDIPNEEVKENIEVKRVLRNRALLQKPKFNDFTSMSSDESSDDSFEIRDKNKKKNVKVAPVFAKAIPKPKVDPEVLEARRKFLMSEMPDTLRRKIEKQENIIPDFDVFPKISHIHQEKDETFWNLPAPNLLTNYKNDLLTYEPKTLLCESLIDNSIIETFRFQKSEPIKNLKTIIKNIKLENANYPVYKSYRILKEKTGIESNKITKKSTPKRKSKSKRSSLNKEKNEMETESSEISISREHLMWIEKYKPNSSEDLIGNYQAISALKRWLQNWNESFKSGKKKFKNDSSDTESDFISSDADSLFQESSLSTTVILTGPCGSGKSSSVYAISKELGLNVIEWNASSRRTGKLMLQELQEATQSHQVHKNKETSKLTKVSKLSKGQEKNKSKKMCVLLIEDIDLIFEQDEGFISAISQISTITKIPVILTTSNVNSLYSQKFMNEFKTIEFRALSPKVVALWFQILCLLEGVFVDISSIYEFLEYNNGDLRKSILEFQYWIQTGGQTSKHKNNIENLIKIVKNTERKEEIEVLPTDDDASNLSLKAQDTIDQFQIHKNLISDFEVFQIGMFFDIPLNIDLKILWWNIPKFLNMDSSDENPIKTVANIKRNKNELKIISDMYDSVAICDVSYRKVRFKCDEPICSKRWDKCVKESSSLELTERYTDYSSNQDILLELNHYLVDRNLNVCKDRFVKSVPNNQRLINMGLPGIHHMSEISKNNQYEEEILNAVPCSSHLDRKAISLDYLPTLRAIARSEKNRAGINVKRHNRFYHYLQNLNVDCSKSLLNFASNTFQGWR